MSRRPISPIALNTLVQRALQASGASATAAEAMAKAVVAAEMDGIPSHGVAYAPIYCEHVECGKVNGKAEPVVQQQRAGTLSVDAGHGFAHPAIDAGLPALVKAAQANGVAAMTISRSYNCGVLGHHTERLAAAGLIGLGFTNAPASIAPVGAKKPVVGTNPFSLAVPNSNDGMAAILIDQSASVVAKSEVTAHKRRGQALPAGWALDAEGQPTTDPDAALAGTMMPAGGAKGFNTGLMTELFAAVLAGAHLGVEASPFSGTAGGPPGTGQCFIAVDPGGFGDNDYAGGLSRLIEAIQQEPDVRLPGARRQSNRLRHQKEGLQVDESLLIRVEAIASAS